MIRLLICDDHAVVRSGLTMLLNGRNEIEVIGEASEGDEAIALAQQLKPDVVLMDLSMPHGKDGMTASAELKKLMPEVNILILTMHDDEQYLFQAIKAGASGYILKNAPHEELVAAIGAVAGGDAYLYPSATKKLMSQFIHQQNLDPADDHAYQQLSEREKEVLSWLAKGYANKEIAQQLFISVKTVETHKSHLMEKLGLKTRPELIKYALQKGLLQFEDE
ncbi:DNA-binding response regulator [Paenibacillus montaniterrae]|uniref:DNA-binding response regulator n=1 Tax=Paenibacillus montaniterrae TaxID=429341 RepID=A0A919YLI6_9BACL|nr:response regulator transcription factor [Paenibacillus montaniterrae]GIP15690.1 DNA-binding response regulator [Paenibacillus montaniterrae]